MDVFVEAEAAISTPTCGLPGGHMGILARGEKGLTTTNRICRENGASGK